MNLSAPAFVFSMFSFPFRILSNQLGFFVIFTLSCAGETLGEAFMLRTIMWIEKESIFSSVSYYCVWKWGNEVDSTRDLSTSTWQWWRVFATVFEWENFRPSHQKENVGKESLFARMILNSSRNTWLQSSTAARINSLRSDIFLLCSEEKKSFPLTRHLVNVMSWWVASFQHVHHLGDWARVDGGFRERKCLVLTVCS